MRKRDLKYHQEGGGNFVSFGYNVIPQIAPDTFRKLELKMHLRQQDLKKLRRAVCMYNTRNYEISLAYFRTDNHESIEELLKVKYVCAKSQLWQNQVNKCAHTLVSSSGERCLMAPYYSARPYERMQKLNGNTNMSIVKVMAPSLNRIMASHGRLRHKLRYLSHLNHKLAKTVKYLHQGIETMKTSYMELSLERINIETLLSIGIPQFSSKISENKKLQIFIDKDDHDYDHSIRMIAKKLVKRPQNLRHNSKLLGGDIVVQEIDKLNVMLQRIIALKELQRQYLDWISSRYKSSHGNLRKIDEKRKTSVVRIDEEVHRCADTMVELEEAMDYSVQGKIIKSEYLKHVAPVVERDLFEMSALSLLLSSTRSCGSNSQTLGYGCGSYSGVKALQYIRQSLKSVRFKNDSTMVKMMELTMPFSPYYCEVRAVP